MFATLRDAVLAILYPQECSVCKGSVDRSADGVSCAACWNETTIFTGFETVCAKCGAFFGLSDSPVETYCRRCEEQHYDLARAAGIYENSLAAAVLHLKAKPHIAANVSNSFVDAFERSRFPNLDLIMPVPLSAKRLHERGFNQASILGSILAGHSRIKIDERSLARTIHTPVHRAAMDRKARELTVRNAFTVSRKKLIEGKNILLVDDVFTSGDSFVLCKGPQENGSGKVYVLTLARAV